MQDPVKSVAILAIANIPLFIFIYFSFFSKKNRKGKGKHRNKSQGYLFPLIFTYIIILAIEFILVYKLLQVIK